MDKLITDRRGARWWHAPRGFARGRRSKGPRAGQAMKPALVETLPPAGWHVPIVTGPSGSQHPPIRTEARA